MRVGRTVKNLSSLGPITSMDAFGQLLDAGMRARRTTTGRYGPISEFTSAILQVVRLQFALQGEAPPFPMLLRALSILCDAVDLSATTFLVSRRVDSRADLDLQPRGVACHRSTRQSKSHDCIFERVPTGILTIVMLSSLSLEISCVFRKAHC